MDLPEAWIETTSYREGSRTLWVIKLRGRRVQTGEVGGDPSGMAAYEAASTWAREHLGDVGLVWKHGVSAAHPDE